MPVALRNNKRRSLYITHNVKDFTKENLRPHSWYIPSSNEAADPYTSVRKLFYDFNKTAFYGEIDRDINGSQIIGNSHTSSMDSKNATKKPTSKDSTQEKELRNSKMVMSNGNRNSLLFNLPPSQDKNNNNENCDTLNPVHISSRAPSNTKQSKFIQRTVFSSRHSDTASLKEESSSYADFYVPFSSTTKQSNFLRRSYKRRSFDPSKFKALDYVQHVNNDDDIVSVSSIGRYSIHSQPIFSNPPTRIDEIINPKPMLERYLRDTEQDICAGKIL